MLQELEVMEDDIIGPPDQPAKLNLLQRLNTDFSPQSISDKYTSSISISKHIFVDICGKQRPPPPSA